jgi:predicted type IV restriction endonuclease
MKKNLSIPTEQVLRLYILLEELNRFLHQPSNFERPEAVREWLDNNKIYPELRDVFYKMVWEWLPKSIKAEVEDGLTDGWYGLTKAKRSSLLRQALSAKKPKTQSRKIKS